LCRASFRVLLSVHPKEKTALYNHLLRGDTDSMISPQPLSEILPQADIFLASYSCTISWAGALGFPAAIIDYHEENAATYSDAKTIEVMRSVASGESWAAGLSEAPVRRETWPKDQARVFKGAQRHRSRSTGSLEALHRSLRKKGTAA
jgi:hypothetical protein